MANHNFSFDGGDILKNMGATWFVSYCYYDHIDKTHMNWDNVSTAQMRTSYYTRSREYHHEWLQHIASMSNGNLSKATIGVSPFETKQMAKKLLEQGI